MVIPVNLADPRDVELVVLNIQTFVNRKIPIRFGVVPTIPDHSSIEQWKVARYLYDNYGLAAFLSYLSEVRFDHCISFFLFFPGNVNLIF